MSDPKAEHELQRIADNLESVMTVLSRINDTIDQLRWQLVKEAETRAELRRQANDIMRRGL